METQRFDTPAGLVAEVRIPAGDIDVRALDTATTTVSVDGVKEAGDLRIDLDPLPDGRHKLVVEYRARHKWSFFGSFRDLDVRLVVPTGTVVTVETGSADLDVDGSLGELTFRTGSGDIRFDTIDGDLTVKAASGDTRGGAVIGNATFHSASGDLSLASVGGDVTARTASGDVRIGSVGGSARVSGVSCDVEIGSVAGGTTSIHTVSGDVEAGVAEGTGVYLDLASTSGDVGSDLEPTTPQGGTGADLDLTIATVSGDVRVRRAAPRRTFS